MTQKNHCGYMIISLGLANLVTFVKSIFKSQT